jgi:hypothetical protein
MVSKLELIEHCVKTKLFEPITIYLFLEIAYNTNVSLPKFIEILKGAHVVIRNDKGEFYKKWKVISKKNKLWYPRISSHPSVKKQYEINAGYIDNHHFSILFGNYNWNNNSKKKNTMIDPKIKNNNCNKLCTWFQFEKIAGDYRINGLNGLFEHLKIYRNYLNSKKNIGIFGESKFTENPWYPLYINYKGDAYKDNIINKDEYLKKNYKNIDTKEDLFRSILMKHFN